MHPTRRVKFSQFVERQHEEGDVTIDMPDGSAVVIPAAILWPEIGDMLRDGDMDGAMRAILGDEQYDRFTGQGGTFKLLSGIYEEAQGVTPGEAPASPES